MKYDAFISYSHRTDSDLAPSLEKGLEQFAKPTFKRRALDIFRDANDLSASPDLWGHIEEGLRESEYFIFLASPAAAKSQWCKKEVEFWKTHKSIDNFLIVLTEGQLTWDESKSDFNWDKTTAIPEELSGAFVNEPLYVDFRGKIQKTELGLHNPDFKEKIVLLAATLHGKSIGDMAGEGIRQYRRTLRIRNSAIAILSLLVIVAGLLAFFALHQQRKAEDNEKTAVENQLEAERQAELARKNQTKAERNANRALVNSLLNACKSKLSSNSNIAMRLAEHAYKIAVDKSVPLDEAKEGLIHAFYSATHYYIQNEGFELTPVSDEIKFPFVTRKKTGTASLNAIPCANHADFHSGCNFELNYTSETNSFTLNNDGNGGRLETFTFGPQGNLIIAIWLFPMDGREYKFLITDKRGKQVWKGDMWNPKYPPNIKIDDSKRRFLVNDDRSVALIESDEKWKFDRVAGYQVKRISVESKPICSAIHKNGSICAIGLENGTIKLVEFVDHENRLFNSEEWFLKGHNSEEIINLEFSQDGNYLLSESSNYKRKWPIHLSKPFIQMPDVYSEVETWDTDSGFMLNEDSTKLVNKDPQYQLLNSDNNPIAEFRNLKPFNHEAKSQDGRFSANEKALINSRNGRIITFIPTVWLPMGTNFPLASVFSEDDKYFKAVNRIYVLDPELIIKRFNNAELFGKIPHLTREEKELYLIDIAD